MISSRLVASLSRVGSTISSIENTFEQDAEKSPRTLTEPLFFSTPVGDNRKRVTKNSLRDSSQFNLLNDPSPIHDTRVTSTLRVLPSKMNNYNDATVRYHCATEEIASFNNVMVHTASMLISAAAAVAAAAAAATSAAATSATAA